MNHVQTYVFKPIQNHARAIGDGGLICIILGVARSHFLLTIVGLALLAMVRIATDFANLSTRSDAKEAPSALLIHIVCSDGVHRTVPVNREESILELKRKIRPFMEDTPIDRIELIYKQVIRGNGTRLKEIFANDEELQDKGFVVNIVPWRPLPQPVSLV